MITNIIITNIDSPGQPYQLTMVKKLAARRFTMYSRTAKIEPWGTPPYYYLDYGFFWA